MSQVKSMAAQQRDVHRWRSSGSRRWRRRRRKQRKRVQTFNRALRPEERASGNGICVTVDCVHRELSKLSFSNQRRRTSTSDAYENFKKLFKHQSSNNHVMINYIISHFTILMAIHPIKQPRKKETRERKHSVKSAISHKLSKYLSIQNMRG